MLASLELCKGLWHSASDLVQKHQGNGHKTYKFSLYIKLPTTVVGPVTCFMLRTTHRNSVRDFED